MFTVGTFAFNCTPTNDGYFAVATVEIPDGTQSATWSFYGDFYGEIGLIVVGPGGEIAYSSGTFLADGSGPYGDGFLAADGLWCCRCRIITSCRMRSINKLQKKKELYFS